MNIICRKTNCKHNNNFVCDVKGLNIGDNSLCLDYQKGCDCNNDSSKNLFKKPPKYNPYRSTKNCCIKCSADCLFNEDTKCHSNGITVNDLIDCPYCVTYFKSTKPKNKKKQVPNK